VLLPLMAAAVKDGEASASNFAYLADRVALREGKVQLYGTQFDLLGPCELAPQRLDDRAKVNDRRKAAGMPSLDDYEAALKEHLASQGCPAK
jgi:hypothetical protein